MAAGGGHAPQRHLRRHRSARAPRIGGPGRRRPVGALRRTILTTGRVVPSGSTTTCCSSDSGGTVGPSRPTPTSDWESDPDLGRRRARRPSGPAERGVPELRAGRVEGPAVLSAAALLVGPPPEAGGRRVHLALAPLGGPLAPGAGPYAPGRRGGSLGALQPIGTGRPDRRRHLRHSLRVDRRGPLGQAGRPRHLARRPPPVRRVRPSLGSRRALSPASPRSSVASRTPTTRTAARRAPAADRASQLSTVRTGR